MPLIGTTIFGGDSITVGLAPFVSVTSGDKITVAQGGQSSGALLAMMKAEEAKGTLNAAKNLVVLAGTNDIGGGLSAEAIFGNLQSIWQIGKAHGLRVIALTIPPAIGYSGWGGRDAAVDSKRRAVNALIQASPIPNILLDSDKMMGSNGSLLPTFDSGDHLHPRKDKMGAAMNAELNAIQTPNLINPGIAPVAPQTSNAGLMIGGAVAAGVGYGLYRWWSNRK